LLLALYLEEENKEEDEDIISSHFTSLLIAHWFPSVPFLSLVGAYHPKSFKTGLFQHKF